MKLKLRTYQKEAVDCTFQKLWENKKKIGVFMPTGSGKTVVMAALVDDYIKTLKPTESVLILSHKSDLVRQTINVFKDTTDLKIGKLQGSSLPNMFSKVIVSTMQSSKDRQRLEKFKNTAINSDIKLIIIDECHYAPVKTYQEIFNLIPNAQIVGFTATPWRQRHNISNWFDEIAYTISLGDLIDENILLKPRLIQIKFDTGSLDERVEACIKISREHIGKSGVVYVNTIEDAEGVRNTYDSLGFSAAVITSRTPKLMRDKILDDYREGKVKILVNVNCLTEGIDAPIANYLIMPFGTKSPTVFQQRVGRVLRKYEGQTEALIYMFGDSPSIAKGTYNKILEATLKDGSKDPLKREDVFDDLEWLKSAEEKNTTKIEWTEKYCSLIINLKKQGCNQFATLLQYKKFPMKYLKDMDSFANNCSAGNGQHNELITDKQKEVLLSRGFESGHIKKLNSKDASSIIASILSWENRHGDFAVTFGKYKGHHIADIPRPYLNWLSQKQPYHPIFQIVAKWRREKEKGTMK